MAFLAMLAVLIARMAKLQKPDAKYLVSLSFKCAVTGAGVSLLFTIAWMIWYQLSTEYCAGNGPLGWIFLYGPPSAAFGQLIALVLWWFKKPCNSSDVEKF